MIFLDLNGEIYGVEKKTLLSGAALLLLTFFVWDLMTGSVIFNNDQFFTSSDLSSISIHRYGKEKEISSSDNKTIISILNNSSPINPTALSPQPLSPNFDRIVFHGTNEPDYTLLPLGYSDNNLIFQIVKWKPSDYYIENSNGEFRDLLEKALKE